MLLGKINYNDYLRMLLGEREGNVVERETGRVIGQHKGYWFHTVGQRKGLGLGGGPWFVTDKDIEKTSFTCRIPMLVMACMAMNSI